MWEGSSTFLPCYPNNLVKEAVRLNCSSSTFVQTEHDVTAAGDLVATAGCKPAPPHAPVGGTCNQTCWRAEACKAILLLLQTKYSASTVQAVNELLRSRCICLVLGSECCYRLVRQMLEARQESQEDIEEQRRKEQQSALAKYRQAFASDAEVCTIAHTQAASTCSTRWLGGMQACTLCKLLVRCLRHHVALLQCIGTKWLRTYSAQVARIGIRSYWHSALHEASSVLKLIVHTVGCGCGQRLSL